MTLQQTYRATPIAFGLAGFLFLCLSIENLAIAQSTSLQLTLEGSKGLKGSGKSVVLVSGDEEYRSEEALPLLAKILSEQHGFNSTVLFAINPQTSTIDPNHTSNIPGLESLASADAMILFTRFRSLPDEQMKHFENFLNAGKPFIAIRTATHPFNFPDGVATSYKKWSWNNGQWPGGLGQQVIGETWYSHHGVHNSQATRGVINEAHKASPILKGVHDVFGPTDVYGVVHLPDSAQVLLHGQVLEGMKPDSKPLAGAKNEPMMPLVWTKSYRMPEGTEGKLMASTIGASVDLLSEDLRRLFVNGVYWCVGLEGSISDRASVAISSDFQPSYFGFKDKTFFLDKKLTPTDMLEFVSGKKAQ